MSLSLGSDGNIRIDPVTRLSIQIEGLNALEEQAMSECRCEQGGNFADSTYGRNVLVWKLSQSPSDRVADIKRIVTKYYNPYSITYDNGIITVN